jgi:hypothetical protein
MLLQPRVAARAPEKLTSRRSRARLARTIERIRREAEWKAAPGPVPLNLGAIRPQVGLLAELELRLQDEARPVALKGIMLLDRLLGEPSSPIYERRHTSEELGLLLRGAKRSLEPDAP